MGSQDKKTAANQERQDRIREQEIENLTSSRHLEAMQIKSLLTQRGLQIHEVSKEVLSKYFFDAWTLHTPVVHT